MSASGIVQNSNFQAMTDGQHGSFNGIPHYNLGAQAAGNKPAYAFLAEIPTGVKSVKFNIIARGSSASAATVILGVSGSGVQGGGAWSTPKSAPIGQASVTQNYVNFTGDVMLETISMSGITDGTGLFCVYREDQQSGQTLEVLSTTISFNYI